MSHRSRWNPSVYSIIRNLEVGEKATVSFEQWPAARCAASNIGRRMHRCYSVLKTTPKLVDGPAEITRTL